MSKLEADLKTSVLAALKPLEAAGRCKVLRQQSGTARGGKIRLGTPGTPDLLVLLRGGACVWLELKRPDISNARRAQGKTRIAQAQWRADAEKLEHRVVIVTSVQDAITAVMS